MARRTLAVLLLIIAAAFFVLSIVLFMLEDERSCRARWDDSGYPVHFGRLSGCRVLVNGSAAAGTQRRLHPIRAVSDMGATVIIMPIIRVERGDVDLACQKLLPSADRRNVVEIWRVLEQREFERLCADLRATRDSFGRLSSDTKEAP